MLEKIKARLKTVEPRYLIAAAVAAVLAVILVTNIVTVNISRDHARRELQEELYQWAAGQAADSFEEYLNGSERGLQEGVAAVEEVWRLSYIDMDTTIGDSLLLARLHMHMEIRLSEPERLTPHLPTLIPIFRQLQEDPYDMVATDKLFNVTILIEHDREE